LAGRNGVRDGGWGRDAGRKGRQEEGVKRGKEEKEVIVFVDD